MICYSEWSNGGINGEGGTSAFTISIAMIFILIIHLILSLAVYFAQVNMKYGILLFLNEIWLLWTICFTFFFIPSKRRGAQSSLQFYFFLRFLASLVAAHKCYVGRIFIGFNYPDFEKSWRSIKMWNNFIRYCPFVFEIQTILFWMGQETYVSMKDYFILRDIQTQLEIQIASAEDPAIKRQKEKNGSKRKSNKEQEKEDKQSSLEEQVNQKGQEANNANNINVDNTVEPPKVLIDSGKKLPDQEKKKSNKNERKIYLRSGDNRKRIQFSENDIQILESDSYIEIQ